MSEYTQADRQIAVKTPLGEDVLLLRSFSGQEELSRLFTFQLDLLSEQEGITANQIVGKEVTIQVKTSQGSLRYFHGFVRTFAYSGKGDRLHNYKAVVVPWLWMLTRTSDCRIFQEKTIREILTTVFDDLGFGGKYQFRLSADYERLDYCVQYRETDFNFVSRLMEHAGMNYFFEFSDGAHTLIIADSNDPFQEAEDSSVEFETTLAMTEFSRQILEWNHSYEFTSGKWAHTDYNFEKPQTDLMAKSPACAVDLPSNSKYELYDYPGDYTEKQRGDQCVNVRMQEVDAGHDIVTGRSTCRTFTPGYKFQLSLHNSQSEQKGYVLTSVYHEGHIGGSYETEMGGVHRIYENTFTCVPDTVTLRPARITSKPMIAGIQTAVVVGPQNEEIYTDKYGRIKVQFPWDREGKNDERSSCWMRVATPWSGAMWGAVHIPRIGMEVLVEFIEGNPDRPLVTGCVYNADNMPPYTLPANKTQSGFKSRSSQNGSDDNFNELRFEDKKNEEEIYFHAERDFNRVVENNDSLKVGFEKKEEGDQSVEIFNNQSLTIGCQAAKEGSQTIKIWNHLTETLENGDETVTLNKGDRKVTLKRGDEITKINAGRSETEAMQEILLKVGNSSIKIDQSGITIKGMKISIEGISSTVKGDATLTLKGGMVSIN